MQVKRIAECSSGSILQYFWPSLSYHLPLIKTLVLSIFEWLLKTGFIVPDHHAGKVLKAPFIITQTNKQPVGLFVEEG